MRNLSRSTRRPNYRAAASSSRSASGVDARPRSVCSSALRSRSTRFDGPARSSPDKHIKRSGRQRESMIRESYAEEDPRRHGVIQQHYREIVTPFNCLPALIIVSLVNVLSLYGRDLYGSNLD